MTDSGKRRVLIVDDSDDLRRVLVEFLADNDYEVVDVGNGREALEVLRRCADIDVVIMDIFMPESDGYELLIALSKRRTKPRVVAISGGARSWSHEDCLATAVRLGADVAMSKPLDLDRLLAAVEQCCSSGEH